MIINLKVRLEKLLNLAKLSKIRTLNIYKIAKIVIISNDKDFTFFLI